MVNTTFRMDWFVYNWIIFINYHCYFIIKRLKGVFMDLYNLLYNFLQNNIFNPANVYLGNYVIGGVAFEGTEWICHTISIIILILLIVCLCCFVKWLVKTIGGLIA